jgi:hypothetical protein
VNVYSRDGVLVIDGVPYARSIRRFGPSRHDVCACGGCSPGARSSGRFYRSKCIQVLRHINETWQHGRDGGSRGYVVESAHRCTGWGESRDASPPSSRTGVSARGPRLRSEEPDEARVSRPVLGEPEGEIPSPSGYSTHRRIPAHRRREIVPRGTPHATAGLRAGATPGEYTAGPFRSFRSATTAERNERRPENLRLPGLHAHLRGEQSVQLHSGPAHDAHTDNLVDS